MYGFFWWDSFKKELDKGYLILFFYNLNFINVISNNINEDERKIKVNPLLISTIVITLTYLVITFVRMGMYTNVIMVNLVFLFLALGLVSLSIYRKNWI